MSAEHAPKEEAVVDPKVVERNADVFKPTVHKKFTYRDAVVIVGTIAIVGAFLAVFL